MVQRSGVIVTNGELTGNYIPDDQPIPPGGFELWGGCTLIFDLDSVSLRYAISRPLLDPDSLSAGAPKIDKQRAESQYKYQNEDAIMALGEFSRFFGLGLQNDLNEPFSILHHQ